MVTDGSVNGNNVDGTEGSYCNWQWAGHDVANNRSLINWQTGWRFSTTGCRGLRLGSASVGGTGVYSNTAGGDGVHGFVSGHNHRPALEVASGSVWVNHDGNGNCNFNVSCGMTGFSGLTSNGSANFDLPKINQTAAAPSGASVTRVSDTSMTVSWTNNSTGIAPYANIKVYRKIDGGAYSLAATLGVVTSWSDTATTANHKYRYRINVVGADGVEVTGPETNDIWTTPGAPTGCAATRLSGGNIRVTWSNNVNYGEYTTRIEHSDDNGSTWAEIASVGSGITQYDHVSPVTNDSHKYRVRSRTSSGTTLNSSYSTQSGLIFADPLAPSAASATRVSDTQINLAWTNNSNTEGPYQNIKVQRATDAGAFALIATLGVVTSYSDTTVSANHKYTYRIIAVGQNGTDSGFAATGNVFTTPGAPTTCVATKLGNGNIQITWANNVNYTEYLIELEESTNGGSTWSSLSLSIASGTTSFTHVSPSTAVTHTYRVRAKTSSGTTLFSTYSAQSNTVTLLATANPPTGLSPSGVAMDATEAITFVWTHNPADATPQTKYELWYTDDNWVTQTHIGPITSATSSHTLTASTVANGKTIQWLVSTAGQNGTMGAGSATASFTTSARPTSTISTPSGGVFNSSHLTAQWTYFQAQSNPQASWHAFLWRDNLDSTYTLLEDQIGTTESQVTFATTLLDGVTYAVRVYVTSSVGLTSIDSGTERETFLVVYLPPAQVTLTAMYDTLQGQMVLTIVGESPVVGVTVAIDTVDLQRQINGGEWVTWLKALTMPVGQLTAVVVDTAPTIKGTNNYRAVIRSALPSSALSPEVENVTAEPRWGFLSTGPSFAEFVRMRARLDRRVSLGRDKTTYHFAGRSKPVELSGEHTDLRVTVSATLYGMSSTPEEMEDIALTDGVVLWRDYTGRRFYASLSNVNVDYNTESPLVPVSFGLDQVDYDENVE